MDLLRIQKDYSKHFSPVTSINKFNTDLTFKQKVNSKFTLENYIDGNDVDNLKSKNT